MADVHNEHTRGLGGYPDTFHRAYDMLVNYKSPFRASHFQSQDGGLAFFQEGNEDGSGRGRAAGQGSGGGRGQGRGAGRGRGRGRGRQQQHAQAHVAETEDEVDDADHNLDNEVDEYIYSTIAAERFL